MIADLKTSLACLSSALRHDQISCDQPVKRTPTEKAAILARLTLQLAAIDYERRIDGNA